MNRDIYSVFESMLDDIASTDADVIKAIQDDNESHSDYLYASFRDFERVAWQENMPIVVCLELMLFRENSTFVTYFDLIDEVTQHLKYPHMNVVAADLDGNELQLVHPDVQKRVVRAYFFIPLRPTLVQFLDFMAVISGLTMRANSRDSLTPTVEVYTRYNGKKSAETPYISETSSDSWRELIGFLHTHKLRMLPFAGGKKKFSAKIEDFTKLLMRLEWFYYDLGYDYAKMEKEVRAYFERLDNLARK